MYTRPNCVIDINAAWENLIDAINRNKKDLDLDEINENFSGLESLISDEEQMRINNYASIFHGNPPIRRVSIWDKQYEYSTTLLIAAARSNLLETVLKLLDKKVFVNIENSKNETAMTHAAKNNNIKMIDALLSHGAFFKSLSYESYGFHHSVLETICKLINDNITSEDLSMRYAALSCIQTLQLKTKMDYNKILITQQEAVAQVNKLVTSYLCKDVASFVGQYLFFSPLEEKELEVVKPTSGPRL